MSHTTITDGGTTFTHNGDYSGDVRITAPSAGRPYIEVPFADLRQLVLWYLRDKAIERLENAEGGELEALLAP
jgi:hypothetical protein